MRSTTPEQRRVAREVANAITRRTRYQSTTPTGRLRALWSDIDPVLALGLLAILAFCAGAWWGIVTFLRWLF